VLQRDLEEARAKRIALENPPVAVVEDLVKLEPTADAIFPQDIATAEVEHPTPQPKLEDVTATIPQGTLETQDPMKDAVANDPAISKIAQGPSPPSSNEVNAKANAIDSDKKMPNANSDPNAVDMVDTSVDSLLTISGDNNTHDDLNLNFDDMDFSQFTNAGENSQSHANDFLSTFGNEDFTMPDLHAGGTTENSNTNAENKKEDLLEMATDTAGDDMMDMGYFKLADESSFDELFAGGEEENTTEGGNTEHDNYDSAFYGN
jgi:hypothetical protein